MKGALKKTMQQRPGAPRFARKRVRLLYLAEDFRLANDYGIQPAHDPEKMLHTFLPFVPIKPAAILTGRRFSPRQTMRNLFGGDDVTRCRIKFHAIASPQDHRLSATTLCTQRFLRALRSPGPVPLACLHVGRAMAHADTEKIRIAERRVIGDAIVLAPHPVPSLPQYSR